MLKGSGIILQNEKGEFLLHLRDDKTPILTNQWCLIGGGIEKGEDIKKTLKREVKEEANLDIEELKFFKKFPFNNKDIFIFSTKVNNSENKLKIGEGKKLKFFNEKDLISLIESLNYSNPYLKTIKEFIDLNKRS